MLSGIIFLVVEPVKLVRNSDVIYHTYKGLDVTPAKKVANQLSRYAIPCLSRDNFSWVIRFQVWRFISDQFPNYFVKIIQEFWIFLSRVNILTVVLAKTFFNVKTWDPKWIQADLPNPNTPTVRQGCLFQVKYFAAL